VLNCQELKIRFLIHKENSFMKPLFHPKTEDIHLATLLNALGDATRLQIIKNLVDNAEISCGEVGIDRLKSTLSYHYKTLREAGLIRTRIEGTQRFMSLRRADLDKRFPGLLDSVIRAIEVESNITTA
jgi:DNA-binding transcriptional ArsR family regulator